VLEHPLLGEGQISANHRALLKHYYLRYFIISVKRHICRDSRALSFVGDLACDHSVPASKSSESFLFGSQFPQNIKEILYRRINDKRLDIA
jgi:hypothetical protein